MCCNQPDSIDSTHPEAAFHADIAAGKMVLNCGARVPIVGYYDEENEPVEFDDLALYQHIKIAFGPTPSGWVLVVGAGQRNRSRELNA
jgi:hypothetical protein